MYQSRGDQEEAKRSLEILQLKSSVPLLISAKFLRQRSMGQVDLATISKQKIIIYEVKSVGEYLTHKQWNRLKSSQQYISQLFQRPTLLKLLQLEHKLE